jgi:hypothetical protein
MPRDPFSTEPMTAEEEKENLLIVRGRLMQAEFDLYRIREFSTARMTSILEEEVRSMKFLVEETSSALQSVSSRSAAASAGASKAPIEGSSPSGGATP